MFKAGAQEPAGDISREIHEIKTGNFCSLPGYKTPGREFLHQQLTNNKESMGKRKINRFPGLKMMKIYLKIVYLDFEKYHHQRCCFQLNIPFINMSYSFASREKRKINPPFDLKQGKYTVGYIEDESHTIIYKIKFFLYKLKNKIRSGFYK